MTRAILNAVVFQCGWLSCVFGAAWDRPWLGVSIGAMFLSINLVLVVQTRAAAALALLAAVAGPPLDLALIGLGFFETKQPLLFDVWLPPWFWMLWPLFASTLTVSFRFLYGRPWLSALLGATSGPLTYYAGHRLGAITWSDDMLRTALAVAVLWGVACPVLVALAERLTTTPDDGSARGAPA